MAALEIQCFLNENQMTALTNYVEKRLFRFPKSEVENIDICFDTMPVRMCVDFEIGFDSIELKQAEVLDKHWNVIDSDSAVLQSRLKGIICDYNYSENQLYKGNRDLIHEQSYLLNN